MKEAAYYVSGLSGLYRQTHQNRIETPLSVTYTVQINARTRKKMMSGIHEYAKFSLFIFKLDIVL